MFGGSNGYSYLGKYWQEKIDQIELGVIVWWTL